MAGDRNEARRTLAEHRGRQSFHRHVRPMYVPRSSAKNTSAPRLKLCACPCRRRAPVAKGARSASSATTTRTSMSLGSGLAVTMEPRRAMRRTPASCLMDTTKRRSPSRRCGGGPQRRFSSHALQSSGGTSLNGTRTSIDRGRPAVRLIKPCRMIITLERGELTALSPENSAESQLPLGGRRFSLP